LYPSLRVSESDGPGRFPRQGIPHDLLQQPCAAHLEAERKLELLSELRSGDLLCKPESPRTCSAVTQ
jgi:hypothetical protein